MIAVLLLVAFQPPAVEVGMVEGHVVDAVSGAPLRKANVTLTLRSSDAPPANRPGITVSPHQTGFVTDATGAFRAALAPGSYSARAERNDYVMGFYPYTTPIVVKAGETTKDITIKLSQTGTITGRVVDEDGDPVPRATVQCLKWTMSPQLGRQILSSRAYDSTDDRGEYRIFGIAPGKCRMLAIPFFVPGPRPKTARIFAPVYFPGVPDLASTQPVHVISGATRQGIDFVMRKVNVVRVSGKVAGERPPSNALGSGPTATLSALSQMLGMGGMDLYSAVNPDGEFLFENVTPGSYMLAVSSYLHGQERRTARLKLEVGERDATGLVLNYQPIVNLAVRVQAEGKAPFSSMSFSLMAQGKVQFGSGAQVQSDAEGHLNAPGLEREVYRVTAMEMPPDYYIKSVSMGRQQSPDLLDLTSGADDEVTITVEKGTAELTGQVLSKDQKPVAGVRVVLVNGRLEPAHFARSDADGRYKVQRVTPGDYRLVLSTQVEELDPDELEVLALTGEKITLGRSARESRQLELR